MRAGVEDRQIFFFFQAEGGMRYIGVTGVQTCALPIFYSKLDWTGYEAARESLWQRQLHLFHAPFYYVEYGIAQLGALQLWMKSKADPRKAVAKIGRASCRERE